MMSEELKLFLWPRTKLGSSQKEGMINDVLRCSIKTFQYIYLVPLRADRVGTDELMANR